MHTEDEAKKLWCPWAGNSKCIASGCMAWRWVTEKEYSASPKPQYGRLWWTNGDMVGGAPVWETRIRHRGYCGVAEGRP
jgi:hypothetical protein